MIKKDKYVRQGIAMNPNLDPKPAMPKPSTMMMSESASRKKK